MLLFVLCATILVPLVAAHADSCYAQNNNPYVMFSTYTPYEFVHENSDDPVNIPQCQPIQFWILSRHGTRYTNAAGIDDMWSFIDLRDQIISNLKNGWGALCAQDVENLKKWTPQAVSTVPMNLTPQGYKDAYNLALRYKSRFSTLLNQSYSPDKFEVRFTDTQRTTLTAFAFIDGIFGSTVDVQLPQPKSADPLLKPSDYCTAWEEEVHDNPAIKEEYNAFKNGPEIAMVINSVSKRLGFRSPIGYDNVDKMYAICRFEKAWHVDSVSPWCAAFSEEELKVLEYKEDLDSYYIRGYGTEMNKKVGCPLAKDFLDRFRKLEIGEQQPAGVFYFSHDTDIQLFFTSLGIGKDKIPLTHDTYEIMANRNWRTSLLTPFGSNFVAIFFKCDKGELFRVQFRLQEKLLKLRGCADDKWGLCDWPVIKKNYGSISKTCNLDFC